MWAGIVPGHAYRSSQQVSMFYPILTKIEMTWLFFVKFRYVGHEEIDSKLYPLNISSLIYTIGENRHFMTARHVNCSVTI